MTRDEAVALFTLDRIKSGPAQMDVRKLTDMNGQYVTELPLEVFARSARELLKDYPWWQAPDEPYFSKVCELMQSRVKLLTQIEDWKYYFTDDIDYEEKAVRKVLRKEGIRQGLEAALKSLGAVDFDDDTAIERAIRSAETEAGVREGKLNQALRVAVTGISRGAGIYETMAVLGKECSLKRIKYAVANLSGC